MTEAQRLAEITAFAHAKWMGLNRSGQVVITKDWEKAFQDWQRAKSNEDAFRKQNP